MFDGRDKNLAITNLAGARRGRPTAGAIYGNGLTILAGDYLLAKSIHILARNDQNLNLIRLFAGVTVGMTEGEVLQASVSGDITIPVSTYEDVIERKTARFIAGCCEAGGRIGGATEAEAASFRMYGHHIGMAFQIADDLLDLAGDLQRGNANVVCVYQQMGLNQKQAIEQSNSLQVKHLKLARQNALHLPAGSGALLLQLCGSIENSRPPESNKLSECI